jgi:Mlc titration factor MtfA (ptsG expression regulator)
VKKIFDWFRGAPVPPAGPFPDHWASFLWDRCAHYRRLSGRLQIAFEQDVQRFITTHRITGVETDVDDPLRLLVAASAVTLSVGWPGYKWSEVSEVLLYPDDFDRDYAIGQRELAGIAHVWGTIILSVPSLWHSFTDDEEHYHLGFHEFAHLLTYERGLATTLPIGLSPERIQLWEHLQADERKRIATGDSVVDEYALQTSEFFPCAVEAFFQKPIALRERHRQLYWFLVSYFRQSPATWESKLRARTSPDASI